jgi:hypothetical protein
MNPIPVSSGRSFSNRVNASRPAAEAPMPTTGNHALSPDSERVRGTGQRHRR